MNAKVYLEQIKVLDTKIKQKEERIEYLKEAAGGAGAIRYDKDRVQTSLTDSKLESLVIQYMQFEQEVACMKKRYYFMLHHACNILEKNLSEDKEKTVLKKIYIHDMSYNMIAKAYGVSRWTIYRWRDSAFEHLKDTEF